MTEAGRFGRRPQNPSHCLEACMPKKAVWLIILFTLLFILGINTGDLEYLLNLGNTICLSCIGVG
jgi:hypothetical protein